MNQEANHLQAGKRFYRGGLIDLSEYALTDAETDSAWDDFITRSPESSIFAHSSFLRASGERLAVYWCLKGKARVAAVVLPLDRNRGEPTFESALIYNGVFTAPPDPKQNIAQGRSDRFALLAFLSEALSERHPGLKMRLPPQIDDIRPFLWHNYGQAGARFRTDVRYTSLLPIAPVPAGGEQETPLYLGMSKSRRQTLRYARREACLTVERHDPALFEKLTRETFARQNLSIDTAELTQRLAIIEALAQAGLARSFVCAPPDQEPEVIVVFSVLAKRACYLFGAGGSERHDSYSGTAVLWDAFAALAETGIEEVDLEGVNSPARGYFKLSFGGSLSPYFALSLEETTS